MSGDGIGGYGTVVSPIVGDRSGDKPELDYAPASRRSTVMSVIGEYRLETPENVQVSFELAGPGSRFCALLIDMLLMWLIALVLLIVVVLAGAGWSDFFRSGGPDVTGNWFTWVSALLILALMLLVFGYFTFFELVLRGQTPGKRYLKLRVIRDDGTPATPMDIVVRNLVRVVDSLPGFYLVGGAACILSPTSKRLGDMAAGTIVIKDGEVDYRAQADRKYAMPPAESLITNTALTAAERRLIRGFLDRRQELLPEARSQLAERLAHTLFEAHGGFLEDAESYIERLAGGRHFEH